jgi:cell division protein FtsI/penicillin-binding protein 2
MEKKKKSKIQQGMLNRYRMIFIIIALFAILIATMLFKTTVVDAPLWNEKAAGTLVSGDSITPERGKILASDGSILSVSVRYYMVRLDLRSPNFKPEAIDSLLPRLCSQLESLHTQPQRTAAQWKALFDNEIKKEKSNRSRTFLISKKMTKAELDTLRTFAYLNSRNGRTIITAQSLEAVRTHGGSKHRQHQRFEARNVGSGEGA